MSSFEDHKKKAERLGVPVILPLVPPPITDVVAVCGLCGLEIKRVMGYYCPQAGCPTGLGGVSF